MTAPRPGAASPALAGEARVPGAQEPSSEQRRKILESCGRLPLFFIENQGQVDGPIAYYLKAPGHSVYFGADALYLQLTQGRGRTPRPTPSRSSWSTPIPPPVSRPSSRPPGW